MANYKIKLELSKDSLAVVKEALTSYNGKHKLIAYCILAGIKQQEEIQKGSEKK